MGQPADQRIHVRVATVVPCVVQSAHQVHGCKLIDLSRGGAMLESELDLGESGEAIKLAIGLPDDERSLQAKAEITRKLTGDFGFRYGIRFSVLTSETRERLYAFIDALHGEATAPRYGHRLEIALVSKEQLKAVMRYVSQGGVGLISETNVVLDEPVRIDVNIPDMRPWSLPGRVARVHRLQNGTYAVGVSFPELKPETKQALESFLAGLT